MTNLLAILIGAVLVNQLVLVRFAAIVPPVPQGRRLGLPAGVAFVTALTLTLAVAAAWLIDARLLRASDLRELRLLALVPVILAGVPLATRLAGFAGGARYAALGPHRSLMTMNCVMLGVALLASTDPATLNAAIAWALATSVGFFAMLALFAELCDRLDAADVPNPFRGAAIALVTAGMMSLAFSGIATVARG